MKNHTQGQSRRWVTFAGLSVALILGIVSIATSKSGNSFSPFNNAKLSALDARAKPHFDKARANVPRVAEELSETKKMFKLCGKMVRDKLSGTHKTEDYLESVIRRPIINHCMKGAEVYGCGINTAGVKTTAVFAGKQRMRSTMSAAGSLALEAAFIRSTMASVRKIFGTTASRMGASIAAGSACAASDGILPIGDIVGVSLAAVGTITSIRQLSKSRKAFRQDLKQILNQAIDDCQAACRKESVR